ncbi:MAG: tetratricopeptide repeat protein [Acidobacteria bacterium]|nr:tetratricopeptide repeat protein [Acidobacteriota bacterium]
MKLSLLLITILALSVTALRAHDGIHEQIIAVTAEIKKSPRDAALYLKRAELYRLHREWRNSERDLNTAARLDPTLGVVDLRRGKLLFDMGKFRRSKKFLERFNGAEPQMFEGVLALGRTLAKLGDAAGAARWFKKAIEVSPSDSAEIYVERAEVLANSGSFVEALDGLDEGIAKLGSLVTLETPAIDLEVRLNRFENAIKRIDRIAKGMPRKEPFCY